MTKRKLLIGIGVVVAVIAVISTVVVISDENKKSKDALIATSEYFDVTLSELQSSEEFRKALGTGCINAIVCRKASLQEVREGQGVKDGDAVLDLYGVDWTKPPSVYAIAAQVRNIHNHDENSEPYHERLDKFGYTSYDVDHNDCSIWIPAIKRTMIQRNCTTTRVADR